MWDYTSLMGNLHQGRITIETLMLEHGRVVCFVAWGTPGNTGTRYLSFMTQQRQSAFPGFAAGGLIGASKDAQPGL